VREGGLEPPHLSAYAPETYASTNSAIPATLSFKRGANVKPFLFYTNHFPTSRKKNPKPGGGLKKHAFIQFMFGRFASSTQHLNRSQSISNSRNGGIFQRSGGFFGLSGGFLKLFFDLKRFRVFAFSARSFSFL
jgi:hypothetical protein